VLEAGAEAALTWPKRGLPFVANRTQLDSIATANDLLLTRSGLPFFPQHFLPLFLCNLFACSKTNQLSCLPLGKRERVTESNAELHSMAITGPEKGASAVGSWGFQEGFGHLAIKGHSKGKVIPEIIL